MTSEKGL